MTRRVLLLTSITFAASLLASSAFAQEGSTGTVLSMQLALGQITPSCAVDNEPPSCVLVNGILAITNRGDEATQDLKISQSVSIRALGLDIPLGTPSDLVFNPVIGPGETRCYGLGGEILVAPTAADGLVLELAAHPSITNWRGHIGEAFGPIKSISGLFRNPTGLVGHAVAPGFVTCP